MDIRDTLYNTLMHSDIDTIKSTCSTNRLANSICNDDNFWINKFTYDDLQIITQPTTKTQWINEYEKIYNSTNKTERLINLLNDANIISITLIINKEDEYILHSLLKKIHVTLLSLPLYRSKNFDSIYFTVLKSSWGYEIKYLYGLDNKIINMHASLSLTYYTEDEIYDVIMKTLYYLPETIITYTELNNI